MRCITSLLMLCLIQPALGNEPKLVVHEWGTFTSLQDETGRAIGAINSDDEPLPDFVHSIGFRAAPDPGAKGIPSFHPDVTMRLETPVMYFYPAKDDTGPIDVTAEFRGGWLTQFYPSADAQIEGASLTGGKMDPAPLRATSIGRLIWRDLRLGAGKASTATDMRVWTAPRAVSSTAISTPEGQSEKYIFYRGVGHLDSPIRVSRNGDSLELRAQLDMENFGSQPLVVPRVWLLEVRDDGSAAYRALGPFQLTSDRQRVLATIPADFKSDDANRRKLQQLRTEMRAALIEAGLFADEAEAMLNTWEASYFGASGTRVFYIVPPQWTDQVLPLRFSRTVEPSRVMIGRVELVTPRHRELIRVISQARAPTAASTPDPRIQSYTALGRFRDALLLDEIKRSSNNSIKSFLASMGIAELTLPVTPAASAR